MKFGIKLKILLGITAILLVCTAFNLGYSYKLFTEDKTSYIFDNGLKKAENISDQINFKLNDLIVRSEFNFILLNNPSIDFEKLINGQDELVMLGVVDSATAPLTVSHQYINTKNINRITNSFKINSNDFIKEVLENANNLAALSKDKTWIYSPRSDLKFLINFSKTKENSNLLFSISDLSPLFDIFSKDRTYSNKIVSLTNTKEKQENAELIKNIDFKKSKKGVFETSINQQDILLAYAFVNEKTLVLSSINKAEAFGITKFLILKTVLFAIFLIGISTIIGIYFSSSITYPIINLTSSAKKIAKGDFSFKVNIKTSDEIKILGDSFNFMITEIRALLKNKEQLIEKLEDYSKNLEQMVEQRTIELKEANDFMALMVNSLDQGLLVFDNELNCNPMFTKACEPIFGVSPLGKTFLDVLSITDEENIQNLKQWSTIAFNEMIPFESAKDLGPRQKVTGTSYTDADYKNVQIDYYPMRNEEDKISNIVMVATDKTNEVQATEKAKEKEAYVSMILKILNNKTQFESFIKEVEDILEKFKNTYSLKNNTVEFDTCMMLFHTLNGGFGIYSITKLQQMARGHESEISAIKDGGIAPQDYIPLLQGHVESLKREFLNFREELDSLVGTKFSTNQSFSEIPRSKIIELKNIVAKTNNRDLQFYFNENFVKVPIINYFKAYDDLCKMAALKINKGFDGLTFHNPELKIEAESLSEFFNVLVHLFRNCIDHGIEDSNTRISKGKSPNGHIDISFDEIHSDNENFISVIIQDDGAGISPEIIRERFHKLNPGTDISHLTDKEIIYKIFDPFFSTRDEVSALSGRGVGMSAIKEVVDRLDGQIEIESHIGKGTIFSFLIPTT